MEGGIQPWKLGVITAFCCDIAISNNNLPPSMTATSCPADDECSITYVHTYTMPKKCTNSYHLVTHIGNLGKNSIYIYIYIYIIYYTRYFRLQVRVYEDTQFVMSGELLVFGPLPPPWSRDYPCRCCIRARSLVCCPTKISTSLGWRSPPHSLCIAVQV